LSGSILADRGRTLVQYSGAGASVFLLIYVFVIAGPQQLRAAVASFSEVNLVIALGLVSVSTVLSCIRYGEVLKTLGVEIPLRLAIRANILGIIGGLMFFQIVGQTLARSAVLARNGVEGPAVVVANVFERLTALGWLVVLAAVSFVYLFGGGTIAMLGGNLQLFKFLAMLTAAAAAAAYVARRPLMPIMRGLARTVLTPAGLRVNLQSFLIHQATLASYVLLASGLAPEIKLLDIAAASAIVMFTASMPISFAGWGVRELSAVYAYQTIGVPTAEALAISIAIGVLSLLSVAVGGLASQLLGTEPQRGLPRVQPARRRDQSGNRLTQAVSLLVPLLAAVLVFFNVYVPVAGGAVNVNLADPVAVCGGLIFLFRYARAGFSADAWRPRYFNHGVLLATGVLTLALFVGFARFGYSEWAFFSRYVGWFILLAYLGTGALIIGTAGEVGRRLIIDTALAAGLAICVTELVTAFLQTHVLQTNLFSRGYPSGAAQNVNAYGAQLCCMMSLLLPSCRSMWARHGSAVRALAVAVLAANVFLSNSLTSAIVGSTILAGSLAFLPEQRRTTAIASALAALIVIAVSVPIQGGGFSHFASASVFRPSSDHERLQTIEGGLQLWRQHPVLGAGLGAYGETVRRETGNLQVIHNTTVWMLAELGTLGTLGMFTFLWSIARSAWKDARAVPPDPISQSLLLTLLTAALFQLPHDIFYQRIFWLMLGIMLFTGPFAARNATRHASHAATGRDRVDDGGGDRRQ